MKTELKHVTIKELVNNYSYKNEKGNIVPINDTEGHQKFGVVGYDGLLDIRPPYHREFIYNKKQKDKVIDSILKGLPINIMYWADNEDGHYEVIDGQQRTMSICEFAVGNFSIDYQFEDSNKTKAMFCQNLPDNLKEAFYNYELLVYVCKGSDKDKLDWFNILN